MQESSASQCLADQWSKTEPSQILKSYSQEFKKPPLPSCNWVPWPMKLKGVLAMVRCGPFTDMVSFTGNYLLTEPLVLSLIWIALYKTFPFMWSPLNFKRGGITSKNHSHIVQSFEIVSILQAREWRPDWWRNVPTSQGEVWHQDETWTPLSFWLQTESFSYCNIIVNYKWSKWYLFTHFHVPPTWKREQRGRRRRTKHRSKDIQWKPPVTHQRKKCWVSKKFSLIMSYGRVFLLRFWKHICFYFWALPIAHSRNH